MIRVLSSRGCGLWLLHAASNISGATFHPFAILILLMSGWYFVVFLSLDSAVNLSLQYVNSINCMVIFGIGFLVVDNCTGGLLCTSSYTQQSTHMHFI